MLELVDKHRLERCAVRRMSSSLITPTMTETIVINNPSPELLKFIEDRQKEKKEKMNEICEKYRKELEDDISNT